MNGANNNCAIWKQCDSDSDDSVSTFSSAPLWNHKGVKCASLLSHEMQSLEKKLQRIIFIQQTDQSYHLALDDIRDQSEISLLVEPSFYGRHCSTSVIAIATSNNTYIFDVRALGKIFKSLSELLEAKVPRKIMHYSHRICDLFAHKHNIKIDGICDTFVELCVVRQDRGLCSLREAISLTLNIPMSELTCDEIESPRESVRNFTGRPLSKDQLQILGKLAILQQKLHDRLIYGNICTELQQMTTNFSYEFKKHSNSTEEIALNMAPESKIGTECINQFYLISTKMSDS
ncbi:protein Exd1 homolog [Drosophila nasuta]|uniref:Protein Exd1 homolog n=1 Tax=Drosophila albomicans TaxID=7291 RepID=A0A6P8YUQ1_DROAB|nr:protein Exd1 homolog [Drosophila albomicans]XP_060652940.1 protein Exd1 homolog [Drosophila nasuta]